MKKLVLETTAPFQGLAELVADREGLFEKEGNNENQYIGRSIYNQSVFINSNKSLIGQIKDINVHNVTDFALEGIISE